MALPVEIMDFFDLMASFWLLLPVMVRQVFYLGLFVLALIGFLKILLW